MAVFREVTIGWGGQEYTFTPAMRLIRRIDGMLLQDGLSITKVVYHAAKGDWPSGAMALIIAEVMKEAGAKVTEAEIYAELTNSPADVIPLYSAVIEAISPTDPGKKDAPRESK